MFKSTALLVVLLAAALYVVTASPHHEALLRHDPVLFQRHAPAIVEFLRWSHLHGKSYKTHQDIARRLKIYMDNSKLIEAHNKRYAAGESTYYLNHTRHADLTNEEYRAMYLKLRATNPALRAAKDAKAMSVEALPVVADPPTSWDWRDHGAVNAVKDQGQCGSCWSFSATAAMEAAWFRKSKSLLSLSEQMCVDCVNNGADTCDVGGEMHDCYLQVVKQGGDELESDYPYTASSDGICKFKKNLAVTSFTGYYNITSGNETSLLSGAYTSVVSVGIDASQFSFQLYGGGVYNEPACKKDWNDLDHGVAVVGYGELSGTKYWTVRNSWGAWWGLSGYILMSRDKDNQCGIATDATIPK